MRPTTESLTGRSLGRLASTLSGLNAIYLPPDAAPVVGTAIVREANAQRSVQPPFAILVDEDGGPSEPNLPIVTRAESIRYRQGNRLAVVPATSVDLASFDGSFREILGPGFPATALQTFDVSALAGELIYLVAEGAEVDAREVASEELITTLGRCLRAVADILVAEQEGGAGWNAKWFLAIDRGAESLIDAIRGSDDAAEIATFEEAVNKYVWACFGLPRPSNGHSWKKSSKASDFVQSMQDIWSSKEAIDLYTREMVVSDGPGADALQACAAEGWDGLDDAVVGTGSELLGLQAFVTQSGGQLNTFTDISEESFLRADPPVRDLHILDSGGVPLSVGEAHPTVSLAASSIQVAGHWDVELLTIVAPLHAVPNDTSQVHHSRARIQATGTARVLTSTPPRLEGRVLRFEVSLRVPAPKTFGLRKVGLSLEIGSDDSLVGYLGAGTATVHVAPPVADGLVTIQWNSGKKTALRQPRFDGPESDDDPERSFGIEMKPDKHHRVVVWSRTGTPRTSALELDPIEGRSGWYVGNVLPNVGASVTVSDREWQLTPGGVSEAPQSILVAAIDNALVDPDPPGLDVLDSLRGQLETLYAHKATDPAFLSSLGHIALPEDLAVDLTGVHMSHKGLLMSKEMVHLWDQSVALDAAFPSGSDLGEASAAFLEEWRRCIEATLPPDNGLGSQWPSKRSVRRLAEDGSIERLLDRYAEFLELASAHGELVRFRAAFPFSASIWGQVEDDVECTAVLLSPWHPLRLAWLAKVEHVLWNAQRARELAGIVEGWRFPVMGPGPANIDRMIAVPIDTGKDQIFVGWSMLVRLATGKARHLGAPSQAAGRSMPGSAPSGLTGTAADAAMRDFIRANSHLPSVTIDLASSARGPRLAEIDASVIRAVREWASRDQPILGVRVLDQLTREGDLPRDLLSGLFQDDLKTSVSWSRYDVGGGASSDESPRSNLRLLQDSGVRVGHMQAAGRPAGVLAASALRRFESASAVDSPISTTMEPGFPSADDPFTRAVRLIEGPEGPPRIKLATAVSALLNDSSDWTISGESFLSPTALAHMISNHTGAATDRMLWEWRPPFLRPSRTQSPLSRRPYVTIARVAGSLVEQVTSQVNGIIDPAGSPAVPNLVDDIFRTLGTRGIGLSSLLSMGGQHASGALGFYLALRLMGDMPVAPDAVQVVLPLDASQTFLDALAPDSGVTETRRRADLLVIRVAGGHVALTPIEIKFYGSGGQGGPLPSPGHEFVEPREQLESTVTLLRKMQAERSRLRSQGHESDAILWDSAMATLFEAGLRMSSKHHPDSEVVQNAIGELARGDLDVVLGRPLILYFKHQAGATETAVAYREGSLDARDAMSAYGALAVRPQPALKELTEDHDGPGEVLSQWSALVEWAIANPVPEPASGLRTDDSESVDAPKTDSDDPYTDTEPALGEQFETSANETPAPRGHTVLARPREQVPAPGTEPSEVPEGSGAAEDLRNAIGPEGPHAENEVADGDEGDVAEQLDDGHRVNSGIRFAVGEFHGALTGRRAEYWPGNSETTQLNMGIVGDLGTGKTQLLKALMYNIRQESQSVQQAPVDCLVFDYKRDFQDQEFVSSVGATVWRPSQMPLNVLDLHENYSRPAAYRRAAAFTTMLERIYKGVGPVQRDRLIHVILELYEALDGSAPTLGEVLESYRQESSGDSVTSILNTFVLGEVFTEDKSKVVSLEEAMKDTVLVVDLNSLGADSYTKNAIVVFFLDMFYERMKRMKKIPPRRTDDGVTVRHISSYLLVDEASNIMKYKFDVLDSLLKEGREFGVGTILSSQYLSHFRVPGANYAETLSTWFVHKVPNATHTELSSLGIKDANFEMAERIRGLKVHDSLYRSDLSPTRFIHEVPFWRIAKKESEQ